MRAIELKRVAAPFKEKENCDKPQSNNVLCIIVVKLVFLKTGMQIFCVVSCNARPGVSYGFADLPQISSVCLCGWGIIVLALALSTLEYCILYNILAQ